MYIQSILTDNKSSGNLGRSRKKHLTYAFKYIIIRVYIFAPNLYYKATHNYTAHILRARVAYSRKKHNIL